MKMKNVYITEEDVTLMEDTLNILKDYWVADDGKKEAFIVESFERLIKDFKEADTI